VKELFTATLAGHSEADVNAVGEAHAEWIFARGLRKSVLTRLLQHRSEGTSIVLVSASLRPYIAPLGRLVGALDVVCTDLEVRGGMVTGRLSGANCRGKEKVIRVGRRFGDIWAQSVAYGNGNGDWAMLEMVASGYRVEPWGSIRTVGTGQRQVQPPSG
jgi:HAD superfamily phosphoserine phosphatase-like hydrolase